MSEHHPGRDNFEALLRQAVRTAPMPELPVNFAQETVRKVGNHGEQAGVEIWLTRMLLLLAILMVSGFVLSWLAAVSAQISTLLSGAPWPLLLTTMAILAAVKALGVVTQAPSRQRG